MDSLALFHRDNIILPMFVDVVAECTGVVSLVIGKDCKMDRDYPGNISVEL